MDSWADDSDDDQFQVEPLVLRKTSKEQETSTSHRPFDLEQTTESSTSEAPRRLKAPKTFRKVKTYLAPEADSPSTQPRSPPSQSGNEADSAPTLIWGEPPGIRTSTLQSDLEATPKTQPQLSKVQYERQWYWSCNSVETRPEPEPTRSRPRGRVAQIPLARGVQVKSAGPDHHKPHCGEVYAAHPHKVTVAAEIWSPDICPKCSRHPDGWAIETKWTAQLPWEHEQRWGGLANAKNATLVGVYVPMMGGKSKQIRPSSKKQWQRFDDYSSGEWPTLDQSKDLWIHEPSKRQSAKWYADDWWPKKVTMNTKWMKMDIAKELLGDEKETNVLQPKRAGHHKAEKLRELGDWRQNGEPYSKVARGRLNMYRVLGDELEVHERKSRVSHEKLRDLGSWRRPG